MLRIARGTGHRAEWTKAPPARRISVRALTWRSGHPVVSKPFPFGCLPSWVNRGLPWQGSAPLGAQELAFRVRGPLADPLLAKEGISFAPVWATSTACLQDFCTVGARSSVSSTFQAMSREVGRARACPPVPKCTRLVPAKNRSLAITGNTKCLFAGLFFKPSDGLEPSTPSLPCAPIGNWSQPTATVFACPSRFQGRPICHRLPPVATALLHKCSILCRPQRQHRAGRKRTRFHLLRGRRPGAVA